ncbi:MAG: ImmA/IrrE family metallo-endopeptidase [Bacteroidota bacterium]
MIDFSEIQIPYLRNEEIWKRADEFRKKHWGDKIPVDIELVVERNLKLLMIPVPNLRSQVDTEAYLSGDLNEIVYDPATPGVRIRFSVAHEVGHFVLHSEMIKKLRTESPGEWKEMQRALPEAIWGRAEYQAREFAGRVLVPPQKLIEALRELQPLVEKARKITPDLELPVIRELVSVKLAKRFFVSDQVILRRLEAEGISPIQ